LYCLISGIFGGLVAVAISRGPNLEPVSSAQQPSVVIPVPSAGPTVDARHAAPVAAAARPGEYTPVEQVNIWVY
jgi:hypothetical protein